MFIVLAAIVVSALLSVFISFQVEDIGGQHIINIVGFFLLSVFVLVEIFKWPLGKRMIDDSEGLASYIFRDADGRLEWGLGLFFRESIISVKGKGKVKVWWNFLGSLIGSGFYLCVLFVLP